MWNTKPNRVFVVFAWCVFIFFEFFLCVEFSFSHCCRYSWRVSQFSFFAGCFFSLSFSLCVCLSISSLNTRFLLFAFRFIALAPSIAWPLSRFALFAILCGFVSTQSVKSIDDALARLLLFFVYVHTHARFFATWQNKKRWGVLFMKQIYILW